jgi:hypothetical protein
MFDLKYYSQLAKQEKDTSPVVGKYTTEGDYITKYREFKYQETLFELFSKQFELAKVDEAREGAVIQVVDAAEAPERKTKPKKSMIAILTTLTSGFGILLFVFSRKALANAVKDVETAQKIAQMKTSPKLKKLSELVLLESSTSLRTKQINEKKKSSLVKRWSSKIKDKLTWR